VKLADGSILVLDAGTGIRELGLEMARSCPPRIDILLTHLHLDHIEGLGFFGPMFNRDVELHIWGPPSPLVPLRDRVARYLSPPLFPVELADIPSGPIFHDTPEEEWRIGSAAIVARPVKHPGPALGYRLEEHGRTIAYIPDHEPALGVDLATVQPDWISGYGLAEGVDVLLHDAQYTVDEYGERVGWGHSSLEHVVDFALIAKVKRLVMFHHDPLHSDDKLERMLAIARERWGEGADDLVLAREGMAIEP
jgi:phosphoribosyl 1,2-cyclic phosphodiesterase